MFFFIFQFEEVKIIQRNNKLEGGGKITKELDKFLGKINVKRQAYHSNSVNGIIDIIILKENHFFL